MSAENSNLPDIPEGYDASYFAEVGSIWRLPEGMRFICHTRDCEQVEITREDILLVCEIDCMASFFSGVFLRKGEPIEELTGCIYKMLLEGFELAAVSDGRSKRRAIKIWNAWQKKHPHDNEIVDGLN